jgi:hypothetical protein
MKNFSVTIAVSNKYNGKYVDTGTVASNIFHLDNFYLDKYIKLKINIPAYKLIDNISVFAEYISTDNNPLHLIAKRSGYIESKIYDLQDEYDCVVKSIDLLDISNINDVDIYIRSSRHADRLDIWNEWRLININTKYKITNSISFKNARFFQFKVVLKHRNAYIKFNGINIEIK